MSSKRELRERLRLAWESVCRDTDPVAALRATKPLRDLLAAWEGVLAWEALRSGATWQVLGDALGTTRQAAWARFKAAVSRRGPPARGSREPGARASGGFYRVHLLEARLKELDATSRAERRRLQRRIQQLEGLLHAGRRASSPERKGPPRKSPGMAGTARR